MYKQRVRLLLTSALNEMTFVIETTKAVPDESYFGVNPDGMILFRSSCLCIQNMSEALLQIDNMTEGAILKRYQGVPWKQIKGMRSILVHDYLSVDEPEILNIVQHDIPELLPTIQQMYHDLEDGVFDDIFTSLDCKKRSK